MDQIDWIKKELLKQLQTKSHTADMHFIIILSLFIIFIGAFEMCCEMNCEQMHFYYMPLRINDEHFPSNLN